MTRCISEEETSITLTWTLSNGGSEIKQYRSDTEALERPG